MNKRILFGVLMICAVAALVAIGTWAYFSDVETSKDNIFTAGTLDLKINGLDDPYVLQLVNIEAKPCERVVADKITVTNAGQNAGIFDLHFRNVVDNGGKNPEPEQVYENANGVRDDISNALFVDIAVDYNRDGNIDDVLIPDLWVTLGRLESIRLDFPNALGASESWDLYLSFHLCSNVDNWGQGDYTTFDIEFTLHQVNAPVPPIPVAWPLPLPVGAPVPPGPGMTYPQFNAWMLAMDDYLGKVVPFTCDIVEIVQPPEVEVCEAYPIAVTVQNVGDVADECTLTVTVEDEASNPLFGSPWSVSTGMLLPDVPVTITVGTIHPTVDLAGQTLTVTAVCDKDTEVCSIYVLKPATIVVTGIEQPTLVQPCEDITITVGVKNVGDKTGKCTVTLTIKSEAGDPLVSETESTATLPPGGTGTVMFVVHPLETWLGTCTVTTDPPLPALHTVEVAMPACIVVTSIQQPTKATVCEMVTLSVDVKNVGGKTGKCTVTLWVVDEMGKTIVGPMTVDTPTLGPGATAKIPFGPFHVGSTWLPGVVVKATGCCPPVVTCSIAVELPPPAGISSTWNYDVNFLLGAEAGEPVLLASVVTAPEALNAHVKTSLVGGPVTITITYTNQLGVAGKTGTVTILADSPASTTVAVTLAVGDTGVLDVEGASNDVATTAGVVEFVGATSGVVGGTLDVSTYPGVYTDGVPLGGLVGGPVKITVKFVNQTGATKYATVTFDANAPGGTTLSVPLGMGNTGVRDVLTAVDDVALTKGVILLWGGTSYIVAGNLDATTLPGTFYDGWPFYLSQATVRTDHLVQLGVLPVDMILACTTVPVPTVLSSRVVIDPSWGGLDPPIRPVVGTPFAMATMAIDSYASMLDGTGQYVYVATILLGIGPMNLEMGCVDYTLTGGTSIGQPYTLGSSWSYTLHSEAYVMGACSTYSATTVNVSVVAANVTVVTGAGTFTDCFEIVTDSNPLIPTVKTDYYSPTVKAIVKSVDAETYFPGVETTVLTGYTLSP